MKGNQRHKPSPNGGDAHKFRLRRSRVRVDSPRNRSRIIYTELCLTLKLALAETYSSLMTTIGNWPDPRRSEQLREVTI
jgi:hypothetical protein